MTNRQRFHYRTLDEIKEDVRQRGINIPFADDLGILGTPVTFAGHTLTNRFAVHPMEGFDADPDGSPGPLAFRRYRRYAEGGAALIWFEATAVLREARSNPSQFWLHEGSVDTYARLVENTRKAARKFYGREPVLIVQLTHSGRYSKPDGFPQPLIAHHSAILDCKHGLPPDYPLVTDDYLDRLQDIFVNAAKLAVQAGFDGIDIKGCHRYLLAELHASHTREGRYGGSFENRTRMLRESLARVKNEVPGVFITTRLNAYDAIPYPYGFGVDHEDYRKPDLNEPLTYVGTLKELGIPVLNLSIGNPYYNPHYGRPFDFPVAGAAPSEEHPLNGIERFITITRAVQEAYPELPVIGSGYTWLRQHMPHVAAAVLQSGGATLIGQGRGSFAYPDSVRDILDKGYMDPAKCCVTCSACTQIMRDGTKTGCVVHDSEIYGPEYRLGRRHAPDRLKAEAQRCRECLEPTCRSGCPAGIDIPGFLKAFAEDDIARAYAILKERNVLPEMCGFVCPAEEQCQGHCIEGVFCQNPISIQDIQLEIAKSARRQGITGVSLPEASGRRVAVVGGGPAGVACAIRLLEQGHAVTLFDAGNKLGGVPDQAIPSTRYGEAEAEIQAILAPALRQNRLELRLNCALGNDTELPTVLADHDAAFLAFGLTQSSRLGEARGVVDALDFLRQAKLGTISKLPDRVAVLGAGNTAMDAASTALSLGVQDVFLIYRRSFREMPAWRKERDHFLEQGGHILLLSQPVRYLTDDAGMLTGVEIARTELAEPDASGRRKPVVVPGSEYVLEVSMAIEAMGQSISPELVRKLDGIHCHANGRIAVDSNSFATSRPGIFAGGDAVNGGTTAVQGIAEGMQAADAIDKYLTTLS